MSEPATLTVDDFERMARALDRYLPLIEPVGRAVLDHLPPLMGGSRVLDIACGTGEPGLTLARRSREIELLGIDGARTMVEIARGKAAKEGLARARFEVMTAERLSCSDGSFDAVISRFGALMFGDAPACARELRRVLRDGGAFSLAVWDDMAKNTLVRTVLTALRPRVPAALTAPFDNVPGASAGDRLREAGFTDARTEAFAWTYAFGDDEALWAFISGPGLFARHFEALEEGQSPRVRSEVLEALSNHRRPDGSYLIPHACRLWWSDR